MDTIAITNKVIEIIQLITGEDVTEPDKLEELGDSLDLIEMTMMLEDEFTIDVTDETYCNWVTVSDVIRDVVALVEA